MNIILPKEPIKVSSENPRSILLYGPEKVGKTSFAAELEGALLIDIEDGADFVEAKKIKALNIQEFEAIGNAIVKEGCPYPYIIVDSITELEGWIEWEATKDYMTSVQGKRFNRKTEEMGWRPSAAQPEPPLLPESQWKSVLSLERGAGYLWLRLSFKQWHNRIKKLAPHIIYLGHLKDKIINKEGLEVSVNDIDLTGKVKHIACQSVDAVGYMFRDKDSKLKISFVHSEELAAGTRTPHLRGKIIDADWKNIFI